MRSSEFFQKDQGWDQWSHFGGGAIRAHEHPLSEDPNVTLPAETRYITLDTYLGDPTKIPTKPGQRPFWEQHRPSAQPKGPTLTMEEYNQVLRSVGEDFGAGSVPVSPYERDWHDYPGSPKLYSPTLNVVTHVETPTSPTNAQIRTTTVFQRETPKDVPSLIGPVFTDALQRRGFPPDAFSHMSSHASTVHEVYKTLDWLAEVTRNIPGQEQGVAIINKLHTEGKDRIKKATPRGVLRERLRTSRHK